MSETFNSDAPGENLAQTVERITKGIDPFIQDNELDIAAVSTDFKIVDLERYQTQPRRIERKTVLATFTGLADYVAAHALDKRTAVYVESDQIEAVIDDIVPGTGQPSWGSHRAALALGLTEEWKAWFAMSGRFQSQRDFINFVQDRAGEIAAPDLAGLIEQLQAINAESTGSRRDASTHLSAEQRREHVTRITNNLPEYLELVMPVLKCEPAEMTALRARLQVKLPETGVEFSATLVNSGIVYEQRVRELVERLRSKIGKKAAVYF